MKTTTIPPVRIAPQLRQEIELALEAGETMAALVETAVRREVLRRREQTEFVRRGLAAIERCKAADDSIPAEAVIAKLKARARAVRKRTQPVA